jgi:hypothetical protein
MRAAIQSSRRRVAELSDEEGTKNTSARVGTRRFEMSITGLERSGTVITGSDQYIVDASII